MLILRRLLVVCAKALSYLQRDSIGGLDILKKGMLSPCVNMNLDGQEREPTTESAVLVISCYIANHTKNEWLKTVNVNYFTVSLAQKPRSSSAACLWLRDSCSCSQYVGQGCSHPKAWLGLENPLQIWLTCMAVGRDLSSSPCEPVRRLHAHNPVMAAASPTESRPRERRKSQHLLHPCLWNHTFSLPFNSVG